MGKATAVVYEYYKGAFALKRRKGGFEAGIIGGSSRLSTKTPIFSMIFGKGERRRIIRTSSENLTKSVEIAAFWQGLFYSWLA